MRRREDLVPVAGSRCDHLFESAARDRLNVRLEGRFGAVVPVHDHRAPRDELEDAGIVLDAVVPEHQRARRTARSGRPSRRYARHTLASGPSPRHMRRFGPSPSVAVSSEPMWKNGGRPTAVELLPDTREILARERRRSATGESRAAVLRHAAYALDAEGFVHVREGLLFGNRGRRESARAYAVSSRSCCRRDAVERSRQRIGRAHEDVLHIRRVAVHLESGDRANAFLEIPHRRERTARDVVGEDAPLQRGSVRMRTHGIVHAPFERTGSCASVIAA